jgi:hypothetical protein
MLSPLVSREQSVAAWMRLRDELAINAGLAIDDVERRPLADCFSVTSSMWVAAARVMRGLPCSSQPTAHGADSFHLLSHGCRSRLRPDDVDAALRP